MYFRPGGRDERERYQYGFLTVQRYLTNKCNNKEIKEFFIKYNIKRIALYGASELGKCIISDLKDSGIEIAYIVDQASANYPNGCRGIDVIDKSEICKREEVDAILITVLYELNKIVDALVDVNVDIDKIININDVVYSL